VQYLYYLKNEDIAEGRQIVIIFLEGDHAADVRFVCERLRSMFGFTIIPKGTPLPDLHAEISDKVLVDAGLIVKAIIPGFFVFVSREPDSHAWERDYTIINNQCNYDDLNRRIDQVVLACAERAGKVSRRLRRGLVECGI
jgi:hypothetical protein